MLVCPHCQFENPDTHKFCQKCGESLTDAICPGCGAIVPFSVEYCPHCGTTVGVVWRALLSPSLALQNVICQPGASISQTQELLQSQNPLQQLPVLHGRLLRSAHPG